MMHPDDGTRPARRQRALWAGLAAAAAVVAFFTIPPLREIGAGFLGVFRAEQVPVDPIDPGSTGDPGDLRTRLGTASQNDALLSDQVRVESNGKPAYMADPGLAAAAAGFHLRLPAILPPPDELAVRPSGRAALRVDLARLRAVLRATARDQAELPAELDGADIAVDFAKSVRACWGDCPRPEDENADEVADAERGPDSDSDSSDPAAPARANHGVLLIQLPSPAVKAPPGLPVDRAGAALLEIMGMPRAEAARFSENMDWATTLVIPIPRYSTSYQQVTVDGVRGSLIRNTKRHTYMLIWVKDGITYALAGSGEAARGIEIASSLR